MLCTPFIVFASVEGEEQEIPLLQEGDYELLYYDKHSARGLISDIISKSVEEVIYEGLKSHKEKIDIPFYRIPVADLGALLANVINDNPDLFYVSSSYTPTVWAANESIAYSIYPQYSMTADEVEQANEVFDSGVEKALSQVNSSMSDTQKALVIHDYICDNAIYPVLGNNYEYDKEIYHSAYGFFYDYNAVCAGYTLTYSYLMKQLGIECEYVSSSAMEHAWNKIKLDGKWYNVDLTFDNTDFIEGVNTVGSISHHFFLKSYEYFSGEQGLHHKDGKTADTCVADSDELDDNFWHSVNSHIYVIDGCYYYLLSDYDRGRVVLTKRDISGNEQSIGTYYYSAVFQLDKGRYDGEDNCDYVITVDDILARLAYLDGRFYISSDNKIYSQLLTGKRYSIESENQYIIGISQRNGEIVYNLYSDPEEYLLSKEEYFSNNITTSKGGYNNYPDINNDGYVNAKDYAMIIKE